MYSLNDFDFEFDPELIATKPLEDRNQAKLLHYDSSIYDYKVGDLDKILKDTLIIVNNTKVLNARLYLTSPKIKSGEAFLLEQQQSKCEWKALARPLKRINIGDRFELDKNIELEFTRKADGYAFVRFLCSEEKMWQYIEAKGNIPIPPYLKRLANSQDKHDYQSMFAKKRGSVAAQTASFHFTDSLKEKLKSNRCEFAPITLHIGGGTFLPVKTNRLEDHEMHSEKYMIPKETYEKILAYQKNGKQIVSVGTTVFRAVESFWNSHSTNTLRTQSLDTELSTDWFLYPQKAELYSSQVFSHIMTNFHQPKSTLLMLICALIGKEQAFKIYNHALDHHYRLFSYGDTSLLKLNTLLF